MPEQQQAVRNLCQARMPLVRRAPSGEQAPAPLPMMAVDEKERRRRAMMGGGGGAMSATVSTMQTNAAFSKSINGETDTMQVRARCCGWPGLLPAAWPPGALSDSAVPRSLSARGLAAPSSDDAASGPVQND